MTLEKIQRYGDLIPGIPFSAVARHPLGDEHDWLRANDMRPEDCTSADLYWHSDAIVAFVAIQAGQERLFATYCKRPDVDIPHSFFVKIQAPFITSQTVVAVLGWLSKWIGHHMVEIFEGKPEKVWYIAAFDISKHLEEPPET
jgi:hypothetical protein